MQSIWDDLLTEQDKAVMSVDETLEYVSSLVGSRQND